MFFYFFSNCGFCQFCNCNSPLNCFHFCFFPQIWIYIYRCRFRYFLFHKYNLPILVFNINGKYHLWSKLKYNIIMNNIYIAYHYTPWTIFVILKQQPVHHCVIVLDIEIIAIYLELTISYILFKQFHGSVNLSIYHLISLCIFTNRLSQFLIWRRLHFSLWHGK